MTFPDTDEGLKAAGYRHIGGGKCRRCYADIEWWETPKDRKIPLDAGTFEPHWSTCPYADEFRRR